MTLDLTAKNVVYENENENCTVLIPKGKINNVASREASIKGHGLKSHPKDYRYKLTD